MTFSDGVLNVYSVSDTALPGAMPVKTLTLKSGPHYYGHETVGVTRYYQALQADQQISDVVVIPDWHDIKVTDVVILDGNTAEKFEISFLQPTYDEDRMKIMRITLTEVSQSYAVVS